MLRPDQRVALFMEGAFAENTGKMGLGVLRYSSNPVVALIDSQSAGQSSASLTGIDHEVPVVSSLHEALSFRPEVLILGIAPPGGRVPESWIPVIAEALDKGLSIVNGLHDKVPHDPKSLRPGQFVWEVRAEPDGLEPASGACRLLKNKRILTIGTDMAVGKMTAGLEFTAGLTAKSKSVGFVATGQIGMVITGSGVPLDAVRLDFAPGSIEKEVLRHADKEFVVIEGQGSLIHPGSSANLPLIRGACPTHLLLCHRAGMDHLVRHPWVKVPPLAKVVEMYQDLAELGGNLPRPEVVGVCVNTSHLGDSEAIASVARIADETGLIVTDPVRFGVDNLVDNLLDKA